MAHNKARCSKIGSPEGQKMPVDKKRFFLKSFSAISE
jgi:hypothetical protein